MKPISDALLASLKSPVVDLAICWKITREDGQVFAFTSHDRTLTVSAVAYQPTNAFSASQLEQKSDLSTDNLDMVALTSSAITAGDLLGGKYDNAQLTIFATDWSDVSKGIAPLMRARIGEVEAQGSQFRAEVRGLAQSLQQGIVKLTSIICRAELGDAQCKVQVSTSAWAASTAYAVVVAGDAGAGAVVKPTTYNGFYFEATAAGTSGGSEPTWPTAIGSTVTDGGVTWTAIDAWIKQGTVTHAFDRYVFRDTGLTEAGDWFRFGLVAWTGGDNDGLSMPVREHLAGGWVTLREPMPFPIRIGDTFTIQVGCSKRLSEDCKAKFDNVKNFDGEPFLPGENAATQFPDAR